MLSCTTIYSNIYTPYLSYLTNAFENKNYINKHIFIDFFSKNWVLTVLIAGENMSTKKFILNAC